VTSASAIASAVRTGRLPAVEVVAAAIEAAQASQASLNAFTLLDTSGALRRAEAVDRLVEEGRDPGPLAGVPVGLKDLIDDAGMPNTRGAVFPTELAHHSATAVRRLGSAGAVIIGRTGLHEFAFGFTSENPWFGPVRNPWDPATSAGGSSGGSGAVVAAGIVPIAIGTDTGGSIRVPAALCGVFGLKVTHGRIPLTGVFPLVPSLDTVGPLARSVEDLTLAYLAMAGDDPADPWSQPVEVTAPSQRTQGRPRLGIVTQWLEPPMSEVIRAGIERFVALATDAGATVERIDVPQLAPPPEVARAIGPDVVRLHGQRLDEHPDRFGADVAARITECRKATAEDLIVAERWASAARAEIARLTAAGFDALVAPTVGVLTKRIGIDTVEVAGRAVPHRDALASFTSPINRIRVPAVAAPVAGTAHQGVSVQLVGSMWSEAALLSVAAFLESAGVLKAGEPPVSFGDAHR
jgi:aspartyl-tRNA(Asn)/glutamyl-tRNA(Gln) amidotransferase subunit A